MIYLDTSAALKHFVHERETGDLVGFLEEADRLCSSVLLRVELARAFHRLDLSPDVADRFLDMVVLIDISETVIERATQFAGEVKSLDAIHVATATTIHTPDHPVTMVTYDRLLSQAAIRQGIDVVAPGMTA